MLESTQDIEGKQMNLELHNEPHSQPERDVDSEFKYLKDHATTIGYRHFIVNGWTFDTAKMQPTQTMLKTISKIIKHYNHESNLGKKKDQQSDITFIDHSYKNLILGDTLREIDYQPMLNKQNEFRYLQAKRTDKRYNGTWLQTYNYCNPNLFKQKT